MDSKMQARHYLILLGFICQGFGAEYGSFDEASQRSGILMPVVYCLVWYLCLHFRRTERFISEELQTLILMVALFAGYWIADTYGQLKFVYVGNALVVFQAMQLLMPVSQRQKRWSTAIAITHIAVGTQVVLDYRFVLILGAAMYLIPRSLYEVEADDALQPTRNVTGLPKMSYAYMAVLMFLFFVVFPRSEVLGTATPAGLNAMASNAQRRDLDMADGGSELSARLILRIEGKNIGYLRSFCLDEFDGTTWTATAWSKRREYEGHALEPATDDLHRSVKVMNSKRLGTSLPIDGNVRGFHASTLQRTWVVNHGGVAVGNPMKNRRIEYSYYANFDNRNQRLNQRERKRYLQLTTQGPGLSRTSFISSRLRDWLDGIVGSETDPWAQAQLVQAALQGFEYEIGAHDLERDAAIDDFIFNEQRGHCERFASAYTILLRMLDIPARVVIGHLPTEKNEFGDFYNVRVRHGHAWTEAFFDGPGWVTTDATPYGGGVNMEARKLTSTVFEWIEYVWYAKIVDYGDRDQTVLVTLVVAKVKESILAVKRWGPVLGMILAAIIILTWLWRVRSSFFGNRQGTGARRRQRQVKEAQHFYGRMLRMLARRRHRRQAHQTPREFLREIEAAQHPALSDIRLVTTLFCAVRYGQQELNAESREQLDSAMKRIACS
jgi:transglutaminase-like putative cysteine protease